MSANIEMTVANIEETTRAKFNTLKAFYDRTWDPENHTLHVGLFRGVEDSLTQAYAQATEYLLSSANSTLAFASQSVVLDVGCGTGKTLTSLCRRFGCRGVGIDISDEQIREAQAARPSDLSIQFIRASGSSLNQAVVSERFTHVISQDAILLVADKQALFRDVSRLLVSGGVLAVADFLSEESSQERTASDDELVYQLVNWTEPLSFETYTRALEAVSLSVVRSERRGADMIRTYEMLAREIARYSPEEDKTYAELQARYESIVAAVRAGKMSWGFFFAQKTE